MKVLGRYKYKYDAEAALRNNFIPADPNAFIEKDGTHWIIKAEAMMGSIPVVIRKD